MRRIRNNYGIQEDGQVILPDRKKLKKAGRIILPNVDPVTDLPIGLTNAEFQIYHTPEMQRLANVKHAGTFIRRSSHSRLTHSLGVTMLTSLFFPSQSDRDQHMRMAALLHDIGHTPFSHALERAFSIYANEMGRAQPNMSYHEERILKTLCDTKSNVHKILRENGFDMDELLSIITGHVANPLKGNRQNAELSLDYLDSWFRDAQHGIESEVISGHANSIKSQHQKIIQSLSMVNRDAPAELASETLDIAGIIFKTNIAVANQLIERQHLQHRIIFSDRGKAIEYASVALLYLCLKRGVISENDFDLTDSDLIRKMAVAGRDDRAINDLATTALQVLPYGIDEPFIVERNTEADDIDANYAIKKTYGYPLRVNGGAKPITEVNGKKKQRASLRKSLELLKDIESLKGNYRIQLLGIDPETQRELDEFSMA